MRTKARLFRRRGRIYPFAAMRESALEALSERMGCREGDPEISAIFYIDHASRILDATVTEGTFDQVELPFVRILHHCLEVDARQLLLVHTHPSGNPQPSQQDMALTRRLCIRLRQQGRRLTDHVILTDNRYFSFRANGLL
jgi:DNA repair protein RadC